MQSLDNSISTHRKTNRLFGHRLSSSKGHGEPNPTWIPVGNDAVRRLSRVIGGSPGGTIGEIANIPMTAHFIGGCAIGDSPGIGVIDPYQRLYGHPGLHVVDGSALSANLGVNPSLSITAQAERTMALWPNSGEVDLRPPLGASYRRSSRSSPAARQCPTGRMPRCGSRCRNRNGSPRPRPTGSPTASWPTRCTPGLFPIRSAR
jgi:cholesterol oxidase